MNDPDSVEAVPRSMDFPELDDDLNSANATTPATDRNSRYCNAVRMSRAGVLSTSVTVWLKNVEAYGSVSSAGDGRP